MILDNGKSVVEVARQYVLFVLSCFLFGVSVEFKLQFFACLLC